MSNIQVTVVDQQLMITNMPLIASGGMNEDYVVFDFDSTWNGYGKSAVFYREDDPETKIDVFISSGKALIPHELMIDPGKIFFGVVGAKDDTILTSQVIWFNLDTGIYERQSRAATEEIYAQMLVLAEKVVNTIDDGQTGTNKTWSSSKILNAVYPVGSVYISVNEANPGTLFGFGTWEQIKDTFLLSAGDTYTNGETGGEATHTLTINEMPKHGHRALTNKSDSSAYGWHYSYTNEKGSLAGLPTVTSSGIETTGGGKEHNNMPPYLAVYMWKRTA